MNNNTKDGKSFYTVTMSISLPIGRLIESCSL